MGDHCVIYLTHEIEQNIIDAQAQISANCGFPNGRGTDCWDVTSYHAGLEVFYIVKPPVEGRIDGEDILTQAQMMAGVVGVEEREW